MLKPRQVRFVEEYLKDLNATKAAMRAGYSPRSAGVNGPRLLGNAGVAAAIADGKAKYAKRAEMTADEWRAAVARLARSDIRQFIDPETGSLLPLTELSDEAALCLSSIKVLREKTSIVGEGKTVEESTVEVKMWSKERALEMYGKHLGLLTERHELSGPNGGPITTLQGVAQLSSDDLKAVEAILARAVPHPDA
jgi:phage terminase small subunit